MIKSIIVILEIFLFCSLFAQQFPENNTKLNSKNLELSGDFHFKSLANKDQIILKWINKSDKFYIGYKILRSENKNENYVLISSYESNPNLRQQSKMVNNVQFKFIDLAVVSGTTYWYKIQCIDKDKNSNERGPISASLPVYETMNKIINVSPQKFRFEPIQTQDPFITTLQLDVPYDLESNFPANISIYSPLGNRLKTIYNGVMEAGSYQFVWNRDTEKGNIAGEGVFIAVFENEVVREATKLILIK